MQISTPVCYKDPRKTRKGWLGYKVRQIHLRDDIPCGLQFCNKHPNEPAVFRHEPSREDIIYLLDSNTLIEQIDIVYNCNELRNVIFLQSSIQKLKKKSLNKYNSFKSHLEVEAVGETDPDDHSMEDQSTRNFHIFADIYHKQVSQAVKEKFDLLDVYSEEEKEWINLECCAEWYQNHISTLKLNFEIQILTTNPKYISQQKTDQAVPIKSLVEFLKQRNSNLLDFIGFHNDQNQLQQQPLFQPHLQLTDAQRKIKQGKLFEGKYMAEKSYFKIGRTVYKLKLDNNRAMFGDVVAIELASVENWEKRTVKMLTDDEEMGAKLEEEADEAVESDCQNILSLLENHPNLLPKGRVVSVIRRNVKDYCGSVNTDKLIKSSENGWKMFEFKPADDRFPSFYIKTYDVKSVQGKRVQVAYDSWPAQSANPLCHFVRVIGNIGDIRAESDVILLEHNVEIKQFSRKAYECLPKSGADFKIPAEEEAYRLDLRGLDVVSIDPPGCKDIDDALHCIRLPNGNLEVGVHIADVSYYVRPDSALDMEARNRCTTVYLVDRRTDMLPKLLTENLCSLRADVDRLAFSTIWQMDDKANIINTKYCKTIIRSRKAFTYMQAQQLMQSDSQSNIAVSIRNLNKIAKQLKNRRLNAGALTLASTQVKITLEEETHSATDVQLYQMVEANYLIEEFMLLANIAVAEKIYERFPSISILRRHTPPKVGELEVLRQILSLYNFELHYQTSKALADSLDKIQKTGDSFFNKLIRILTTRCMNEATYFCSADFDPQQFFHYGLAAPFYTHFTSPIRRYADILVHRLLAAAIDLEPLPNFMINKIKMTKVCDKMNLRNRMARYASRASSDYHTYQFFKQKQGQSQEGILTAISETSLTIMLVKYGLECKYELGAADAAETVGLNKGKGVFNVCRVGGKNRNLFQYVDVKVNVEMQGFHKKISIVLL